MLDGDFLRRVRRWTVAGGFFAGGLTAVVSCRSLGAGVLVGALWSALNLRAMEGLLRSAVLPHDRPRDMRAVFLWSAAKLCVYVLAVWLLVVAPFPVVGLAAGLTIMLAAIVLAGLTTRSEAGREAPRRGDDDQT